MPRLYSLHLGYAKLVCFLGCPEPSKVAPVTLQSETPKSGNSLLLHLHNVGNIPRNLHEGACSSKRAGDLIGAFIVLGRPVSEELIQIRCDERHGDGLGVRG